MQPARQVLRAYSNGTAQIQHLLNGSIKQGSHGPVDGIPQARLRQIRRHHLFGPDAQCHRIGGLFGFSSGLPTEIALLVGMEASQVVRRR